MAAQQTGLYGKSQENFIGEAVFGLNKYIIT